MSDSKRDTSPSDRTQFEFVRALFSGFKWHISTSPCWPFGGPNIETFLRLFFQKVRTDHKLNVCERTIWSETCLWYHCMICNFVTLSCGIYVGKGVTETGFCLSISAFLCRYSTDTPCSYYMHCYILVGFDSVVTPTLSRSRFPLLQRLKAPDLTWLSIESSENKMNFECRNSS